MDGALTGFDPIARHDARVLVVGTAPSVRSLAAGEYYAHPRNAFWPIVLDLFADGCGAAGAPDYAARRRLLIEARIALWDVLRTAVRPGSLDSSIVGDSAVPNDFAAFLAGHPRVRTVCFNGRTARALWDRLVAPRLPSDAGVDLVTLPSTSPANARTTFEEKLAAWSVLRRL